MMVEGKARKEYMGTKDKEGSRESEIMEGFVWA